MIDLACPFRSAFATSPGREVDNVLVLEYLGKLLFRVVFEGEDKGFGSGIRYILGMLWVAEYRDDLSVWSSCEETRQTQGDLCALSMSCS